MANKSPRVEAFEKDNTLNAIATGDSGAGAVGNFNWGPIGEAVVISSVDELEETFSTPTDSNFVDWFSAANFLAYSGYSRVVRVVDESTAKNSGVGVNAAYDGVDPLLPKLASDPMLIKNNSDFDFKQPTASALFAARNAGKKGDSLAVHIADSTTFSTWAYKEEFDTAPNSTPGSEINVPAGALDEIHVVVVDRLGYFTNVPGAILERFAYLSKAKDSKDINGSNAYYVNVINRQSNYVYAVKPISGAIVEDAASNKTVVGGKLLDGKPMVAFTEAFVGHLGGGNDGAKPSAADYIEGFETFEGIEDVNINMLVCGGAGNNDADWATVVNKVIELCTKSANMVAFVSPKLSDVVNVPKSAAIANIIASHAEISALNSYGFMSSAVKLQYDKYNDVYRWVPGSGDDAGLWARTHREIGKFASAAGYTRGLYSNVASLAFSPDLSARDQLYKLGINSVFTEKGVGTLLLGDRTLQPKNSAFSSTGTRFLFIDLRTIIKDVAKYNLFEFNDTFTRSQFRETVEPIIRDIRGKRGIVDYMVVCDDRNNPTSVVEAGEFVGDIYIKPQYSIQYIKLNFNAIKQNVSFDEAVGA